MQDIAATQKKTLAPLEDETGRDPFSQSDEVSFPVTLGEFIALYDHVPA
jgi:hypothetical protein